MFTFLLRCPETFSNNVFCGNVCVSLKKTTVKPHVFSLYYSTPYYKKAFYADLQNSAFHNVFKCICEDFV